MILRYTRIKLNIYYKDFALTEEIHRRRASLHAMPVIFELVDLVEVFDADLGLFDTAGWLVHVLAGLLTFRPNHLHIAVADLVISRLAGGQFPAEEHRRDAVAFVTKRGRQAVPSAPVLVLTGRRPVPRVIIADPVTRPSRHPDDDVRAVHRIEVVLGRIPVSRRW